MSLNDFSVPDHEMQRVSRRESQNDAYYCHGSDGIVTHDLQVYHSGHSGPSQLSNSPDVPPPNIPDGVWKSPFVPQLAPIRHYEQQFSHFDDTTTDNNVPDDFSSAGSTPFGLDSSLSPTSTPPDAASPIELPGNEQALGDSLLFSPHYRSPSSRNSRKPFAKKSAGLQGPTRLSSMLPLTSE